jgi:hypothetical protein
MRIVGSRTDEIVLDAVSYVAEERGNGAYSSGGHG